MRVIKTTLLLASFLAMGIVNAQNWNLVWGDEFNYTGAPDSTKWNYTLWDPGMVNNEYQSYTDRPENVRVENGALIIEGRRDWGNGHEYTSARINSAGKGAVKYGRIEARMILPGGLGTWSAFWMMPDNPYIYATTCDATTGWDADCDAWPNSGEMDIMEYVGYDYGNVHGSVHSKKYYFTLGNNRTGHTYVSDAEWNYKVYAIEWFEDHIDFFVDDYNYYTIWNDGTGWESWPFNHEFHVILNLAIGGDWGAAGGFDPSIFESGAKMYVDYVRMYEATTGPKICDAISLPALIQAEDYCNYEGIRTESTIDDGGGLNVAYIDQGDWFDYTVNVPKSGTYTVSYRVASMSTGGSIQIENGDGSIVYGVTNFEATGDWQNWTTVSHDIELDAGEQVIKLTNLSGGWNINWIEFENKYKPIFIEAENYAYMSGIQTEACSEGGLNIGYTDPGDWMFYQDVFIPEAGTYTVEYRVASQSGYGVFRLEQNSGATIMGEINVPGTGGWQNWTTVSHTVQFNNAGNQGIGIGITEGGFNLNWIRITAGSNLKSASVATGIIEKTQMYSLYPNPANDVITVASNMNMSDTEIIIFDISGKQLAHFNQTNEESVQVNVSNYQPGIYYVHLSNDTESKTLRFIKQ